jgi:hypothetical protein
MILAFAGQSFGQLSMKQWEQYEKDRKDVGSALVYWMVVPGGGHFYAHDALGLAFLGAEVITAIPLLRDGSTSSQKRNAIKITALIRVIELLMVPSSVNAYNEDLRNRSATRLSLRTDALGGGAVVLSIRI